MDWVGKSPNGPGGNRGDSGQEMIETALSGGNDGKKSPGGPIKKPGG